MLINREILNRPATELGRLAVLGALLAICAYLVILIVLQFIPSEDKGFSNLAQAKPTKVLYWSWFRSDGSVAQAPSSDQHGELPEANISALLLGVMMAGDNSLATLKFNGKPEAVYRVGDELPSGYKLVDIETYRIVVRKNGVTQQVLMKKPETIIETQQVSSADQASQGQLQQEPQEGFALANMFGAVPVNTGSGSGLKLNNLSPEVTALADLQDGDVVVQIDGKSVQDLMANPAQWISYSAKNSLPVTVMRQGQEEIIYVNAASLSAKILPNLGLTR